MSTQIDHDDTNECHCPTCDLNKAYLEELEVYNAKKKFQVLTLMETGTGAELESNINKGFADEYELTAVLKPYVH